MASHGRLPGLVTQDRPRAVQEPCRGHGAAGPSPGLPRRTRRPVYPHMHGVDAGVPGTARRKPARSSPSRHRFLPRHSLCPATRPLAVSALPADVLTDRAIANATGCPACISMHCGRVRNARSCLISRSGSSMMCPCRRWMLSRQEPRPATHGLPQTSPGSAGSKAGLEVMPIDGVTLSDGHGPGERAQSRRSVRCDTPRQQPSMPAPNGGVLRIHWPVACMALGASFTLYVGCSAR